MARVRMIWSLRRFLARSTVQLRLLPRDVRRFYMRSWIRAIRRLDVATFVAPASPEQVAALLDLASERVHVVELGTGGAITAIALALADSRRIVITYDPNAWPFREHYLALVPHDVRERIELRARPGEAGPQPGDDRAEFLFVDSSHAEAETFASFEAWRRSLASGAIVVFHDYENADFPGVAAAIRRLALVGHARCGMFVWQAPPQPS